MTFSQWVQENYNAIPESKRHLYSSDSMIAAVCYYRGKRGIYPTCLSGSEAKAFINSIIIMEETDGIEMEGRNAFTEKSIKHNMKRNLLDGTLVDIIFDKCSNYMRSEGIKESEENNIDVLSNILANSGILNKDAAAKISKKIIKQQTMKPKTTKELDQVAMTYTEIRKPGFFTGSEIAIIKKRASTLSRRPDIQIKREIILHIVDEVLRIVEEVKVVQNEKE